MSDLLTSPTVSGIDLTRAVVTTKQPDAFRHLEHEVESHLHNIQGNIFGGFNKDYQSLLFLRFTDLAIARKWLDSLTCEIATSEEVLRYNRFFKLLKKRRGGELGILKVTWMNIAFTYSGLSFLGAPDLNEFPIEGAFAQGMKQRSAILGDNGDSDPINWVGNLGSKDIHAVLIIASDTQEDLHTQAARYLQNMTATGAVELVFLQEGAVRQDQPGHEHFGFKDGVSQPGIRGVDRPDDPVHNPDQGHNGQDLLWPGEFVVGLPTQIKTPDPNVDGPNPAPGAISVSGPDWTRNGSYMVFRRLAQDVGAFQEFIAKTAARPDVNMTPEVLGAKIVGRYASGCPLEPLKADPVGDPNIGDPAAIDPTLPNDDSRNNFFEYDRDMDGNYVPRAAHIRKAYPRNQSLTPDANESDTQTHRLLRRGIPFGTSFRPSLGAASHAPTGASYPDDRGLLFICYQSSLENQFEFVQQKWVDNPNFPLPGSGQDPLITPRDSAIAEGPFAIPQCPHLAGISHFVTTTGGEYFFQPSISALLEISR